MRKDMRRGLLFILLCALIFLGVNQRYKESVFYRSIEGIYRYENIPQGLQIVNVGSSHGEYGIDYQEYRKKYRCFNFAFSSQMLDTDLLMLETYRKDLSENCVVIIPVSYFSFYMDAEDQFSKQLSRYYRVLDYTLIPQRNVGDLLQYRIFPILTAGKNVSRVFKRSKKPLSYEPPGGNIPEDEDLSALGEKNAKRHLVYIDSDDDTLDKQEHQVLALKKMLAMVKANKWKAVVITTPLLVYYDQWFSPDFKRLQEQRILSAIQDGNEDAVYLDYSGHEVFYNNTEYFFDTDHLNKSGRIRFTELLINDLQERGML